MTEGDQITLYSCQLCGFCETSLAALTKHTSSHIKSEQSHEQLRPSASGNFDLVQLKDGENMSSSNEITSSEEHDGNGKVIHIRNISGKHTPFLEFVTALGDSGLVYSIEVHVY